MAPDFSAPDETGALRKLSEFRGRPVVLYFYPKDGTPGCTAQACALADDWSRVAGTGVTLFGVSPDSVRSHARFRAKYRLPYRLLSDEGHHVADAFGVWIAKKFMGREYLGNERSTFVIGPDGRIEHVLAAVKPDAHLGQLMDVLAS